MDQERIALLALHFIPGIGNQLIKQLIAYRGSAEAVFKTPRGKLVNVPGIGAITAASIVKGRPFQEAENEIRKMEAENAQIVFFYDKDYPARLKSIADAPTLLYTKGTIDFEKQKMVAIVGTRNATAYGKRCVEELLEALAEHDATIVSGLAYGIDIHAHKHALKNTMQTIGVMGSGLDVIYPSSHSETARKMLECGGIVTENPFGTKPDAHLFPARNRIIAGLADALVVIEAAEKGGALITAEIANSYNKDVFAFPGNIGQNYSAGCNNLIKSNKAHLITSIKDLEYLMSWLPNQKQEAPMIVPRIPEGCSPDEHAVIKTLLENDNELVIDELSQRCGLLVNRVASILLNLEFRGLITSLPGKRFRLVRELEPAQ